MSALQVDKVGKNKLQDGGILSSSNFSGEWRAFESTFEEGYYTPNIHTAATDDVSHLLEHNNVDLDPTFLSLFEDDNDVGIYNLPEVSGSHDNEIAKDSSSGSPAEPENLDDSDKNNLSKGGTSTIPTPDAEDSKIKTDLPQNLDSQKSERLSSAEDSKIKTDLLQNLDSQKSERLSSAGESKTKTVKCFSGKSKKSGEVTRTVTTETIFNGSIADIVKTRKRRAQCFNKNGDSVASDYALSHEMNAEISNTEFTNSQVPVKTAEARIVSPPAPERSPESAANPSIKIKICLPKNTELPECQNNSSASKKIHKKKNKRKHVSNPGESCFELDPQNRNIINIKPQVKELEKDDVELPLQQEDCMNIVKNHVTSYASEVDLQHSSSNGYNAVNDKKSESGELSSCISNVFPSKKTSISEQASRSETELNDNKKECIEQHVNPSLTKKKLRGIEEYKAHKAKHKQPVISCSVSPSTSPLPPPPPDVLDSFNQNTVALLSKLQNKGIEIPVVESNSPKSSVMNTCNFANLHPSDVKHTVTGNSDKVEFQLKKSPSSESDMDHFHLENAASDSCNSVSSEVPASSATTKIKSEVTENSAISLSKSSATCLPIQTHLPKDQCAFIKKSSQKISADPEVTKTSHDIPAGTDGRCQDAQSVVATEYVNSTIIPCDRTNSETKHNSHSPIPYCTVYSTLPKHNASVISTELSSPSTSAKGYYADEDVRACKELSRSRSVSSSSSSSRSSDKCYKRRKRSRSSSLASDTHSMSSYKRHGSYNSKSAVYKKHSSGHSLKSRWLPSKPKKSVKDSRYRSHSRSLSSSSSSSVRYKRRKRRKSRSRSHSYSRSPSTSDDDFTYDTYKLNGNVHRSSLSPVSRRERHLKHHSRFQNYSSTKQRSSSRSSHHYANSKHLRYSTLPSHRKERRRHRQYSTSSYSTDNSYSRHRESSSRSRSRSKSYDRSYYKQYQPYRRQQQLSWEEQQKQIDERRVVYVGLIPDGYTRTELMERFRSFGEILSVRIHKRVTRRNDNFGFVTFKEKLDAYKAVEYGNAHPLEPKFDISFGGRKGFCKQEYSDLDKENEMKESCHIPPMCQEDLSFDKLLKAELQRVRIQSKKC